MSKISVVCPCYNEEANVEELYGAVKNVFAQRSDCTYEILFIDNASTDGTTAILKKIAQLDRGVKVIINARNFGHVRSPYYGLLQTSGDAAILLATDFQDPPELIDTFITKWQEGHKIVLGIKNKSEEFLAMFLLRKWYYDFVSRVAEIRLNKNNTGFGLYDRCVIDVLRGIDDPYPYFRGLICEIGFEPAKVNYIQPKRKRGISSQNFYKLYDIGMLGITSHSKVPLRLATIAGFVLSMISFAVALAYFIAKLVFWEKFILGTAPILIGVFLFSSVQLFFVGILGEYIGAIHTQVLKRPLVVEKERINF